MNSCSCSLFIITRSAPC
uniref:Uncharacterized protein n=1 Tax=Anguilla anguilla TaxID=7936 RepID=A0A0E9XVZ2_ANGAN